MFFSFFWFLQTKTSSCNFDSSFQQIEKIQRNMALLVAVCWRRLARMIALLLLLLFTSLVVCVPYASVYVHWNYSIVFFCFFFLVLFSFLSSGFLSLSRSSFFCSATEKTRIVHRSTSMDESASSFSSVASVSFFLFSIWIFMLYIRYELVHHSLLFSSSSWSSCLGLCLRVYLLVDIWW